MTVRSYNSYEEMVVDMRRRETAANAMVTPEQLAITPGDFVEQPVDPMVYGDLRIMGRTLTEDEYIALERHYAEKYPDEVPFDETECREEWRARLERGYIYGWWSSAIEAGEWGDVHRYNMLRTVTQEEYTEFMAVNLGTAIPVLTTPKEEA